MTVVNSVGLLQIKCKEMKYFFLSSSHLEDRIWFRDDDDFKVGMNYVALVSTRCEVSVIVFVLMSNHVHFVLFGKDESAMRAFYAYFKMLYSKYYKRKYGVAHFLRGNTLDCRQILPSDEALERVIAYVLMNPVAANICLHPVNYPWGCGNCFFSPRKVKGRPASTLGPRERRRLFHSEQPAGRNTIVGDEGYILPESFVRKDMVEAVFRTPGRLNYFLNTSSKARHVLESENALMPSFRDQNLAGFAQDICFSLFRKTSFSVLEEPEKQRLVFEVHRRSGADPKQLARVLEMPPTEVATLLSRY